MRKQVLGIAVAAICLAALLGAQYALRVRPQDKEQFPYREAVDPKVVIQSFVGPGLVRPDGSNVKFAPGVTDPLFISQEMLGRPTNTSVTINVSARKDLEVYYEYGTKPGTYTGKTAVARHPGGEPFNTLVSRLKPNTRYYYRLRYREPGSGEFLARTEHSFHTARPPGSTFTFVTQYDPHLTALSNTDAYRLTLKKMLADNPDFLVDLGDSFQSDNLRPITKQGVEERVQLLRSYWDLINHSSYLFMALGNHEGEWGRHLNGTTENVAVWDTLARKRYIPNPEPNEFYLGSSKEEPIVGRRQSYYSFHWGDALFIVLDPYWYQPKAPEEAGQWWTTLGRDQYEFLRKSLETSKAKYKFVFAHNLIGGLDMRGLMRGGIEAVKYTEMGGYNYDGTWGWDKERPGWAMPIHPLLVANNATIFFKGHDHLYAKQDLDGIVYQTGPMPAREGKYDVTGAWGHYDHGTVLGGSGYIRVRVSPEEVKVDYVQTYLPGEEDATHKDGMIADSYTIKARATNPAVR